MNKQIQTLLRKSGLPGLPIQNDIFLEKFGQLVVEECANIAAGERSGWEARAAIEIYFGVKNEQCN